MSLNFFWKKKLFTLRNSARAFFSLVDYLVWALFDFSKFKRIKTEKIKKVLILLINQEKGNVGGDFVTLGILNHFKKEFPDIEISVLSDKKTISQFGNVKNMSFIEHGVEVFSKLKKEKFDALIDLNNGGMKINRFSFIPYKVGFTKLNTSNILNFKNKISYTKKIYNKMSNHMVDLRFKMLEALGFKFSEKKPFLEFTKQEEKKSKFFLDKNRIKKFIVIHPGGKYVSESYKAGKWPPHLWNLDRYAKVADYFAEKNYQIIITGTKEEEILAQEIIKDSNNKNQIISACGKLSIKEVGALLKKSNLLIATDTAIVHIAYQDPINAKIVELMGPSLPEVVGAWPLSSPRHKILIDKGPCCRSMRKLPFKDNYNCLKNIKIEDVIKASNELLI